MFVRPVAIAVPSLLAPVEMVTLGPPVGEAVKVLLCNGRDPDLLIQGPTSMS